ncbi:GNAT family N-acetyltransferase [Coralliovum pocilloporae]|uniref:GNAT family N-acetyltransferase n=1 Tax=Coralliovum pocilloporae TaxID=3066369 RepID=UPI003306AA57
MNKFDNRHTSSIRRADSRDCPVIAQMLAALFSELDGGEEAQGDAPGKAQLEGTVRELIDGPARVWALVAEDENEDVEGVVLLNECAAIYAGGVFGEITELYVKADARSRGVGANLVEAARAFGGKKGWKRLEVGAPDMPRWQRTFDFYSREGFELVGPRLRFLL